MATPRKKHKLRDGERTYRELLNAIGELLLTHGYTGLKVSKIARHIGKDKSTIRYHFGKLADLEKAYIQEKDHWPPFFERFRLDGDAGKSDVQKLFTELMQENFRSFMANPEMQKIILWQISEENPLMRSISEAREAQGAKLLAKASPYFVPAGISFKAITGLLLGGIYYFVLHASTNKSTVCGIDVNLESDRKIVMKSIGQIIEWAFAATELNGND
ncbi:MAG TPA: TetR/AcrR family transcriptional regulator [Mucilaginibacter sp.]|jgi:AcrR family transcriptional regulator|nr:TetR/AcrR family transcriptional regulator [Mucilaginibacter sp.]